jgi:hypothetical protein
MSERTLTAIESRTPREPARDLLRFNRIVVIGGGCYGSWYAGQLARATERGALAASEIVVVDRNPACKVAGLLADGAFDTLPLRLVHTTWDAYLAEWLGAGSDALAGDAMVPSPLMPHLCLDWLMARARARWPERTVRVAPLPRAPNMPWERAAPDGRHYVSFATWTCPVNCIEPARCPATRGTRDWSMPPALAAYVRDSATLGAEPEGAVTVDAPVLRGPVIFHCVHRTYGVGMIDAAGIAEADDEIARWGADGPVSVLVGTVSHCHGALGVLDIA